MTKVISNKENIKPFDYRFSFGNNYEGLMPLERPRPSLK